MKLSITELKEIKQQLDKGLTLCLTQTISLKQYDNIIKQIDNYINKEIILWLKLTSHSVGSMNPFTIAI